MRDEDRETENGARRPSRKVEMSPPPAEPLAHRSVDSTQEDETDSCGTPQETRDKSSAGEPQDAPTPDTPERPAASMAQPTRTPAALPKSPGGKALKSAGRTAMRQARKLEMPEIFDDGDPAPCPPELSEPVEPPEPTIYRPVEEYFEYALSPGNTQTRFILQILGDERFFEIAEFEIDDGLSGVYTMSVTFLSDEHLSAQELLGQSGRLTIRGGDGAFSYFHGEFDAVTETGHSGHRAVYRATLFSPLERLSYTTDFRVFQHKSIIEIFQTLLEEADIPHEFELFHGHGEIGYVVQYEETTTNFIHRKAERYGLFMLWRHGEDRSTLVITDDSRCQAQNSETYEIEFIPERGMANPSKRFIPVFTRKFARKAQSWSVNEFDLARPKANLETSSERVAVAYAGAARRKAERLARTVAGQDTNGTQDIVSDEPSKAFSDTARLSQKRAATLLGVEDVTAENGAYVEPPPPPKAVLFRRHSYDGSPIGKGYIQADLSNRRQELLADILLAAENVDSTYINGSTNDSRFFAGFTFSLVNHPDQSANDIYFLIRTRHVGKQPQALEEDIAAGAARIKTVEYTCEFVAVPALVAFKSRLSTPEPQIHGVQIAEVWCPEGEVVHVDARGRIQVYFYWDHHRREDDQRQSCWVDISRGSAGSGSSIVCPPRHKDKAVISYVNGDPEQPITLGFVSSATTMPNHGLSSNQHKFWTSDSGRVIGAGKDELSNERSRNDDPDRPELKDRAACIRTNYVGKHKREVCAVGEAEIELMYLMEFATMFTYPMLSSTLKFSGNTAYNQAAHPAIMNGTCDEKEELTNASPLSIGMLLG